MRAILAVVFVAVVIVSVPGAGAAEEKKGAGEPAKVTAPPEPEGMVRIFNGKDLTDWDGAPDLWSAKDGVLRGETTKEHPAKGNTFLIWKGGTPGDFELRLSYRMEKGNSGVQYRSKHLKDSKDNAWVVAGYQAEVANEPGRAGFLYHEKGRGRICLVGEKVVMEAGAKKNEGKKDVVGSVGDPKAIAATYKLNDWNDYIIIAKGNHIVHYLNGVQTIDFTDNDENGRALSGIIALQIHAGPPMWVEFKDIRLRQHGTGEAPKAEQK
ncbi:MAG: DUF1080 domain-containing protein [Planctomycetota bacterium]|nr:DUF1080 domain-containing protein [Planctomycetota bacterium]